MLTLPSLLVNAASDDFFEGGRDAQSGRTANDFLIRGLLPDQPAPIPGLVSHAGQLSFPEHGNSAMFFWLMTNSTRKVEDRLVIYLNGGPGCTSMDGALLENSPLMFDEKTNKLVHREWNLVRQSAVLYIDQPVGTGYSFGPISSFVKTFDETASRLVDFLDRFYALFPKMKSLDVYIAGESEAGVYIPYTAREILKRNAVKQAGDRVNLRGIALGNGWIDSEEIVRSYPDYAERHGLYAAGDVARDRLKSDVDLCLTYLKTSDIPLQQPFCESIMFHFSYYSLNKDGKCLNVYHVGRVEDAPGCGMNWPPKVHIMIDYLNRKDVQQALHVKNDGNNLVTECNSAVGSVLRSYKERVPSEFLPELASHMKIMLYYGDQDILCNYLSAERLLAKTEWNGARGFSDQTDPVMEWSLDGSKAGYVRAARNMTYVRIFNASHMVGVEKPKEFVGAMSLFLDAHQPSLG
ncbi:alpha/beta-hydrolase, partial [Ramicandelaber brevisporus]